MAVTKVLLKVLRELVKVLIGVSRVLAWLFAFLCKRPKTTMARLSFNLYRAASAPSDARSASTQGNVPFDLQSQLTQGSPLLSPNSQVPPVGSLAAYGIRPMSLPLQPPELIFGSSLEGAVPMENLPSEEERPQSSRKRRRATHLEDTTSGTQTRIVWENWMVTCLLNAKKTEWDENEQLSARQQMLGSEAKWGKIADFMRARQVHFGVNQLRTKWESLLGQYKRLKDHQHKSGNPEYKSMTRDEKREAGLPYEFLSEWD
ncbi:hypothetical protein R1flu_014790 [Riccia fluitans]|uniref:Myb/SANT-like DNA-binding domain-containing protein n=1 Tax=Riccia fluitans TaxID=41844 RepID=A0ABD1YI78_9MARC